MLGAALADAARMIRQRTFPGSIDFWERRYANGGNSGDGSDGVYARFKANFLNGFVVDNNVRSVIEFGCGDGKQLALAAYPKYLGLDVSSTTLRTTISRFRHDPTKSFMLYHPLHFNDPTGMLAADIALSLDVIYHLVEDDLYYLHLQHVFDAAERFVLLYTSDLDTLTFNERTGPHVRHRPVVRDLARLRPDWRLLRRVAQSERYRGCGTGTSFADFYVYARTSQPQATTPHVGHQQ